jgi:mannose-6-phosphate isomerase-like protein (cupin superfamily)
MARREKGTRKYYMLAATRFEERRMSDENASFQQIDDVLAELSRTRLAYREFLRVASMSAGVYVLAAGSEDRQVPHRQDELYYVIRGKARMQAGVEDRGVSRGSLVFVAAEARHRFYDIEEELVVLVFFAPAETE